MRKILLLATLFFSTYCLANVNTLELSSAVQNGFSHNMVTSPSSSAFNYGGKDISRPKMAIADEKTNVITTKTIC